MLIFEALLIFDILFVMQKTAMAEDLENFKS